MGALDDEIRSQRQREAERDARVAGARAADAAKVAALATEFRDLMHRHSVPTRPFFACTKGRATFSNATVWSYQYVGDCWLVKDVSPELNGADIWAVATTGESVRVRPEGKKENNRWGQFGFKYKYDSYALQEFRSKRSIHIQCGSGGVRDPARAADFLASAARAVLN